MTTYHYKFEEVKLLVDKGVYPPLLTGEKGSGKTTIIMQVAEALDLKLYVMAMTRQTTLSHLLGFVSINGDYIRSQLREAAEFGGVMLLDEIDASDPNVLLSLNTIENGYIAFPDGIMKLHKDFRLCATSNPQGEHAQYTGRAILDAATLDRFDIIKLPTDPVVENAILGPDISDKLTDARITLQKWGVSKTLSMRDGLRLKMRTELNLLDDFLESLFDYSDEVFQAYLAVRREKTAIPQSECTTSDELMDTLRKSFN